MTKMGDRIRAVREELGWSHAKLSAEAKRHGAKITPSGIVHLEERSSETSRSSRQLALALSVNHDWLLTGKGPKELGKSIDRKLQLFPPEDFDDVYDLIDNIVEQQLSKRNVR